MATFALGFAPHVQSQACPDLCLRAYPVDLLLPLAIASVAPLHRMRSRGQQFVIEKRQGLFQRGRKELLERLTELLEPLQATPQLGQLVEGCLGPTPSVEQRVDLLHERTQRLSLGSSTADAPSGLPFGFVQVTLDEQ